MNFEVRHFSKTTFHQQNCNFVLAHPCGLIFFGNVFRGDRPLLEEHACANNRGLKEF